MRAIILLFLVECLWGRDKGVTAEEKKKKKTKGYFIFADEAKVEKWQWWSFVEKNSYLDFTVCNSNGTFLVINSEEKEGEILGWWISPHHSTVGQELKERTDQFQQQLGLGSLTIISQLLFKEEVLRGICLPDHATPSRAATDTQR